MTMLRKCHDCGREFVCALDAPEEEVCVPCYEAFNGMTIEELCSSDLNGDGHAHEPI